MPATIFRKDLNVVSSANCPWLKSRAQRTFLCWLWRSYAEKVMRGEKDR